jgi:hypothetical protein
MNITIIDPMKWVRSRPNQFFFGRDTPDPTDLLIYIMADIIKLGKGECAIRRTGEWFVIGSDVDWLKHEQYSILDLFNNVVAAPAHGEHSMRGEILVNAFARDVAVLENGKVLQVKGDAPPPDTLEKAVSMQQAIVFRL